MVTRDRRKEWMIAIKMVDGDIENGRMANVRMMYKVDAGDRKDG